jgi:endoglucanase
MTWPSSWSRRSVLRAFGTAAGTALASELPGATAQRAPARHARPAGGVNLAGADFGHLPGVHGRDYLYPTRENVDYYRGLGFSLVRLPFKWERLQPQLEQPFAAEEGNHLAGIVRYATKSGLQVVLDPHNYAKRRIAQDGWSVDHLIGSAAVPASAFHDFWARLAALFRDDPGVVFGLMNEPTGIDAEPWLHIVNGTLARIRTADARQLVLVPGVAYTGAHSWLSSGNTILAAVEDPARRFAFDVHQYFDHDSSGTHPEAVSGLIGAERIVAFQTWARQHGFTALLGEFNGGRNPAALNALADICQEMDANPDVWLGWAAWAGGPRWPEDEMFNLEPWKDGRMRAQTRILARFARGDADAWIAEGSVLDADFARGRVHGAEDFRAVIAGTVAGTPGAERAAGDDSHSTASRHELRARPQSSEGVALRAGATLLALMQQTAFSLVAETRDLGPASGPLDLMTADGASRLRLRRDGSLAMEARPVLSTGPQPIAGWRARRKIGLALDRRAGRLVIAATGARAAEQAGAALDELAFRSVAFLPAGGALTRLTAYARCFGAQELDARVA